MCTDLRSPSSTLGAPPSWKAGNRAPAFAHLTSVDHFPLPHLICKNRAFPYCLLYVSVMPQLPYSFAWTLALKKPQSLTHSAPLSPTQSQAVLFLLFPLRNTWRQTCVNVHEPQGLGELSRAAFLILDEQSGVQRPQSKSVRTRIRISTALLGSFLREENGLTLICILLKAQYSAWHTVCVTDFQKPSVSNVIFLLLSPFLYLTLGLLKSSASFHTSPCPQMWDSSS